MNEPQTKEDASLLSCTTRIASAYAAGNKLTPQDLVEMVLLVAQALASTRHAPIAPEAPAPMTPEELVTAIRLGRIDGRNPRRLAPAEIEASVQDRYLISFENGRSYFLMRRHLTAIGTTPDAYRAKWGLPDDYPVVAPYFARRRKHLAKRMSLGRHERPPRKAPPPDKRKFRLENGVWIPNVPTVTATRDRSDHDPERQNPVPSGTGMKMTPEVAAPALTP